MMERNNIVLVSSCKVYRRRLVITVKIVFVYDGYNLRRFFLNPNSTVVGHAIPFPIGQSASLSI